MPSRRTDRLERWGCVLKYNKAKCKVLGWGNPEHKYRLSREWTESSLREKDLGMLLGKKLNNPAMCICSPESQLHLGLHP